MPRRYAGLGPSRVCTRIPSTRRLGTRPMSVASQDSTLPCARTTFPVSLPLFSWRCLAASTSYFLHAAMNLRPPSATVSTRTSASNAVAFQSPVMPLVQINPAPLISRPYHSGTRAEPAAAHLPHGMTSLAPSSLPRVITQCGIDAAVAVA